MTQLTAKAGKLADCLAVTAWRRALLRHSVAAGVEHIHVLNPLGVVRTVVDVGANRGQFALAARHCFPDAQVVSFEPLDEPASVFERIFVDDERTTLFNVAIGPDPGEAIIHVSAEDDSSSLLPITAQQNAIFPGTAEASTATVQIARLVEHVPTESVEMPALLKLDVQGFEREALSGCEDVLDCFKWVYTECSFIELYAGQALADDVIGWLRERAFALIGVYNLSYAPSGQVVQADFLFRNKT